MTPHTKHLRVFLAVARLGSLSKAADELHRAHSAVARSIVQLESAFATPLFERTSRGMLLTDAGKVLLNRVEFAMDEMNAARQALADTYAQHGIQPRNSPIFTLAVSERRLAILVAFAEQQHMGAVAQQLNISQPAVSMALRDLELSVGLDLLDRTTSALRLTAAGLVLVTHLKRALTQLRLATAELTALTGVLKENIIVGALPFGRTYILPAAIARLHKKHPSLRFTTIEAPFETLTHGLWCGDIDFILGALHPVEQYTDLIREDLFNDHLRIISRAGHPLADREHLTLHDTLATDWVLPKLNTPTREVLSAAFKALDSPEPVVTVESSDLSIIRGLLLESDMITAASRHLFHHETEAGVLKMLPIELPDSRRPVGILRRTQEHSSPGARLLIDEIRKLRNLRLCDTGDTTPFVYDSVHPK